MSGVQLHNDAVGQPAKSGGDASGGGQIDLAVSSQLTSLNDGHIHFPHKSVAQLLRHL